jgi:hypothetical protein
MKSTKLILKEVPAVPNLKTAEGVSASGKKLVIFSSDADSFHISLDDGSLESFGGITVVGAGVSAKSIDPNLWFDVWLAVKGLTFGSEGWGQVGSSCKLSTTFTVSENTISGKRVTSMEARWICTPVPE